MVNDARVECPARSRACWKLRLPNGRLSAAVVCLLLVTMIVTLDVIDGVKTDTTPPDTGGCAVAHVVGRSVVSDIRFPQYKKLTELLADRGNCTLQPKANSGTVCKTDEKFNFCCNDAYDQNLQSFFRSRECLLTLAVESSLLKGIVTPETGLLDVTVNRLRSAVKVVSPDFGRLYSETAYLLESIKSYVDGFVSFAKTGDYSSSLEDVRHFFADIMCSVCNPEKAIVSVSGNTFVLRISKGVLEDLEYRTQWAFQKYITHLGTFLEKNAQEAGWIDQALSIRARRLVALMTRVATTVGSLPEDNLAVLLKELRRVSSSFQYLHDDNITPNQPVSSTNFDTSAVSALQHKVTAGIAPHPRDAVQAFSERSRLYKTEDDDDDDAVEDGKRVADEEVKRRSSVRPSSDDAQNGEERRRSRKHERGGDEEESSRTRRIYKRSADFDDDDDDEGTDDSRRQRRQQRRPRLSSRHSRDDTGADEENDDKTKRQESTEAPPLGASTQTFTGKPSGATQTERSDDSSTPQPLASAGDDDNVASEVLLTAQQYRDRVKSQFLQCGNAIGFFSKSGNEFSGDVVPELYSGLFQSCIGEVSLHDFIVHFALGPQLCFYDIIVNLLAALPDPRTDLAFFDMVMENNGTITRDSQDSSRSSAWKRAARKILHQLERQTSIDKNKRLIGDDLLLVAGHGKLLPNRTLNRVRDDEKLDEFVRTKREERQEQDSRHRSEDNKTAVTGVPLQDVDDDEDSSEDKWTTLASFVADADNFYGKREHPQRRNSDGLAFRNGVTPRSRQKSATPNGRTTPVDTNRRFATSPSVLLQQSEAFSDLMHSLLEVSPDENKGLVVVFNDDGTDPRDTSSHQLASQNFDDARSDAVSRVCGVWTVVAVILHQVITQTS